MTCNRRFEVSIRVYYLSGLYDDEKHDAWGTNRIEAENDLLERRDQLPFLDTRFIETVKVTGCVEVRDGVLAGGAA